MSRFLFLAASVLAGQIALGQNVLVQRGDDARTAANLSETTLNSSNVNSTSFGKVFKLQVDGYVFAQPLYVSGLSLPGQGAHNVVFIATQHDSVYAFDADSGVPIWQRSLGTAITETPGNDIEPEVGITSTPVIDPATDTMYVVAKSVVSGAQQFAIYALDITTGADKIPAAVIAPTVSNPNGGTLAFVAAWHYQRPGLVLANGVVYVAFGSRGDFNTWQGWMVGFNASTLAQVSVFCTNPDGSAGGGLWTGGEAPPLDTSGNLYVSTGNGNFDGQTLWGNAFLKLGTASGLSVLDYFAPYNQAALGDANLDISSAGYILLPDSVGTAAHPHIMVASGKAGAIYLLDRDNMGHFNGSYTKPDSQIIQEITNAIGVEPINPSAKPLPYVSNNFGTPTYWNNSIYWCGVADACKRFTLSNGLLSTSPASATAITYAYPGADAVISASSSTATSAIMWVVERDTTDNISTLHAYDATNLASEFYNSNQAAARRDVGGPPVKFIVPTVINGKVYVAAQHEVDVYGLLADNLPLLPAPTFGPAGGIYGSGRTVSIADTNGDAQIYYTLDGSNPTSSSALYAGPITVSSTTTVNAIAVLSGYRVSPIASATYTIGTAPVGFVQGNYATPQLPESAVTVAYTQTQKSADLNVVVVGWNDASQTIGSVTDSSGNLYTLAVGPTVQSGTQSQAIYYAKNIGGASANSNTVTVTFNGPAAYPDVRVAEYSGLDPSNPLDVTAAAMGTGTSSSSGAVTTTFANDVIVGANMVQTGTTGPGTGFTSRMITMPDGDILEDEIVSAAGSYTATAPMSSGKWIMQLAAFRQMSAGSGPTPTAPTGLGTSAVSGSEIDLSWGAATETGGTIKQYLIERCTGSGCSSFTQVGTSAGTSFDDTGLTGSTSYTYRVRAEDTTGTDGPYSNTATTTTLAAVVPTAPSSLAASVISSTQISLSWGASTETGGTISQYLIERCQGSGCTSFAQVGTSATTSFNDSGLSASTSYSYRVRAQDTVGNDGPYSNVATTSTTAPTLTAPTSLTASALSSTQINLGWGAASETGGSISQYLIERCQGAGCSTFAQVGTSTSTSYGDTGLAASTTYTYRVRAKDALGNLGPYSNTANATTSAGQTQSIAFVQSNYATPQSSQTTVSVYYTKAQTAGDLNVVVVGWNDSTRTITSVTDTSGNLYTLAVGPTVQSGTASQAIYYAKNVASASAGVNAVTVTFSGAAAYPDIRVAEYGGINTTSPLDATAAATGSGTSSSSGAATTTSANDLIIGANMVQTTTSGAGSGFTSRMITAPDGDILEDEIVSVTGSYTATAPMASGKWIMQMVAFRQMGTGGGGGSTPTAPTSLSATAVSSTGIDLSWGAATETGGTISQYLIERCAGSGCTTFAQVGTSATTSFGDTGLTGSTSYTYRVRAQDTTGTDGPYSGTASATTSAGQTAPIAFVQSNYATPQSAQTTVSVYYTKAQTAGDLNVVVVGWNDSTRTITSVTDTSGNMYTLAVGPTVQSGTASQAIYYAKNIGSASAGVNAVTVTFSGGAAYPDIRVAEYSGINTTSPLDATAAAMGSGTSSSSGAATTTFANDLIIGGNLVQTTTSGAGSGFTSRTITLPDGDILEDEIVSATGSYTATAPLASGKWIMQMAAFKGQ